MSQNKPRDTENKGRDEDKYTIAIGEMGKWQLFMYIITTIPMKVALTGTHYGIVFMAPKTSYRCLERENKTGEIINMTCYSDCTKYQYFSQIETNIIEQWNLICDRAWLADFTQIICMFGVLVGSVLFGFLADRYGRRLAVIFASTLEICSSFLIAFCPNLWTFTLVKFLIGVATGGTTLVPFVLLMEIFGLNRRDLLGAVNMLPLSPGFLLMSIVAYYFRTWRVITVAMAMPTLTYLTYFCCLPESPKWLISVGRLEEACVVMTSAAKWNKLPTDNMMSIVEGIVSDSKVNKNNERKATFVELITLPSLRIKNLCSCIIWFVTGLTFYGTVQYLGQTSSNMFLMLPLLAVVQVPGFLLGGYVSSIYGRRVSVILFFIISTLGNGFSALPDEWYYSKLIAGSIGFSCSGAVFTIVYVYTTELFPTVARSMGLGASSTASRLGTMVAPLISGLRTQAGWIPSAVFTIAPIFAVIACFYLPETKGKKIEDYLEES